MPREPSMRARGGTTTIGFSAYLIACRATGSSGNPSAAVPATTAATTSGEAIALISREVLTLNAWKSLRVRET